jgi:hypothetical protein
MTAPAADPVTDMVNDLAGDGLDSATTERIARLARFLLGDESALAMRIGPYRLDTQRAAIKAAVTAAVLAVAIEGTGLDSVPVVVLAAVVPFLIEIESTELAPGDELVVAALRIHAQPGGSDHDWYRTLPPELRAQLTQIEFLNLLGRLRDAGIISTGPAGDNDLADGRPNLRLRLRLPWR